MDRQGDHHSVENNFLAGSAPCTVTLVRWAQTCAVSVVGIALAGCPTMRGDVDLAHVSDAVSCEGPAGGFGQFVSEAPARGLPTAPLPDEPPGACVQLTGAVVSSDLDGDGDIDLLLHDLHSFPELYANDGTGHFREVTVSLDPAAVHPEAVLVHGAADLNGDLLPEVLVAGAGFIRVAPNLGNLQFGEWETIYSNRSYPRACINSLSWGDVDGDGDLDLLVPTTDMVHSPDQVMLPGSGDIPEMVATADLLLYNEGGVFVDETELGRGPEGGFGLSLVGAFTDRDADGDLDILVTSERPSWGYNPSAFFRNDLPAGGGLVDDAFELDAALSLNGMGLASTDLNGDWLPDYCISDSSWPVPCLISRDDRYVSVGSALGLLPGSDEATDPWHAWSMEFADFDNDGRMDAAATAGNAYGSALPMPDALWRGIQGGRFAPQGAVTGFASVADHYGMVVDDFDLDGQVDIVMRSRVGEPLVYWANHCHAGSWISVQLRGTGDNAEGFGARIELVAGSVDRLVEVHGLRGVGQSSPRQHFGLGDEESVDRLTVIWPDGARTEILDVPTRRLVVVDHPDRAGSSPPSWL